MLALARIAVVQAPVLHLYRRREVCSAVDVAAADILLVDRRRPQTRDREPMSVTLPTDFLHSCARCRVPQPEFDGPHAAEPRWVYFTSGTTGRPKGVLHTDATLLSAARGFVAHVGLGDYPDELGSIAFPIAHVGGIVYLAAARSADFPVLMIPKVDADDCRGARRAPRHRRRRQHRVLSDAVVGPAGRPSRPLMPTLRMLIGGGAPCPPEVHRRVRECIRIPIVHAYGMTEAPMIGVSKATDTEEQRPQRRSAHPGHRGADQRDRRDRGARRQSDSGIPRPPAMGSGDTADGWFRSGDQGHLRADGRIVVTGRTKDLIIRKGENVAPEEIENELLAHPLVDESRCSASPTNCAASWCARSCVVRPAIATSHSMSSAPSSTNAG